MNAVLFDYGVGNLHSLRKALETIGVPARITVRPRDLADAELAVLPGVGSFGHVMASLAPAADLLRDRHRDGRPILGVCIGKQVLYEASEESPGVPGLGILPGKVVRLPAAAGKIPHMGWNTLHVRGDDGSDDPTQESATPGPGPDATDGGRDGAAPPAAGGPGSLVEGLAGSHVYYVHSYAAPPGPGTMATTTYGAPFSAVVRQGNTVAFQFHPEKSSRVGRLLLERAVRSLEEPE